MSRSIATVLTAPGIDAIGVEERDVPAPGPGEALLRMRASCLNYHDAVVVRGLIPGQRHPIVPLSDGCGVVEAIGSGVSRVSTGDRVMPNFYPGWLDGRPNPEAKKRILGEHVDGCCAQHLLVPADCLVRAPSHLSDLEAATLPCAALTAWRALHEAGLEQSDVVLLQGTGGVSIFALQFAKTLGARVIITSSSDAKLERAMKLGADHTINYRDNPEWASAALELTNGRGVDLVVDVGGAGTLSQSVLATKMDGNISIVGVLGGYGNAEIPVALAMTRNIGLKGVTVGSREDFEEMCVIIEGDNVQPVVSDTFSMQDLAGAVEHLEAGRHFGKIAIEIP